MAPIQPVVRGALAQHPAAHAFAAEVLRVHRRYANEVVGAFAVCPFMKDADNAFGHFCVMLDRTPDPTAALNAILEAESSVVHLVYPCVDLPPSPFDRFAAGVRDSLASWMPKPPVTAVFHPALTGDFSTPHRLVSLLRRAPDPFIQFVPEGLHAGGTVFVDMLASRQKSPTEENFERLKGEVSERIPKILTSIHEDRARSYAPFLEALRT